MFQSRRFPANALKSRRAGITSQPLRTPARQNEKGIPLHVRRSATSPTAASASGRRKIAGAVDEVAVCPFIDLSGGAGGERGRGKPQTAAKVVALSGSHRHPPKEATRASASIGAATAHPAKERVGSIRPR